MTKKVFRRKPETLEAIQWTGDNLMDVLDFTGRHPRICEWFTDIDDYVQYVKDHENLIRVYNPEGEDFWFSPGAWIFKDKNGNIKEISEEELQENWIEKK